ncbi:MAG: stage II sporulation protein D [Bacilli bacterium]|nr:stage II sporulation protein D [Bacilli bacterium]
MKRLIIMTVVIISIPFLVVTYWKDEKEEFKEVELKYLSNQLVRVKRSSGEIENIPMEEYVVGVVAGEMPVSFELEALKAQSVASRTYVLKRITTSEDRDYDVVDTVSNQVYLDEDDMKEKWGNKYEEYVSKVRQAVNETSMEYLEYEGEIIDAMFFSTSNGYTEDSGVVFQTSLPYLKSVESSWDEEVAKAFYTSKDMSLQEFYERLGLEYNKELKVEVLERSDSNRIVKLKINGVEFKGRDVYDKLGLRSCDFEFVLVGSNVEIKTKGYGHGVGMSQYGAHGMAKEGYSYKEILGHYYVGTTLVKKE